MTSGSEKGGLRLRPLRASDEVAAEAAHEELAEEGFQFLLGRETVDTFADYLALRGRYDQGDLPAGWVPDALLMAVVGDVLVGRTSVRYELNDQLRLVGGHVGFAVRRAHRRHGHATEILRQSLDILARRGIGSALVTCDDDNLASARTIERCGGILDDVIDVPDRASRLRRYWVPTSGPAS